MELAHIFYKDLPINDDNHTIGTNIYSYTIKERDRINVPGADLDWLFPEEYSLKIGVSLKCSTFNITPKVNDDLRNFLEPSTVLINSESGQEEFSSVPLRGHFFYRKKGIEEAKLNKIGTDFYINESCFLYDRNGFIKQTFITALNKTISIYGSISYFNKK